LECPEVGTELPENKCLKIVIRGLTTELGERVTFEVVEDINIPVEEVRIGMGPKRIPLVFVKL
jgi:hypothetical protein